MTILARNKPLPYWKLKQPSKLAQQVYGHGRQAYISRLDFCKIRLFCVIPVSINKRATHRQKSSNWAREQDSCLVSWPNLSHHLRPSGHRISETLSSLIVNKRSLTSKDPWRDEVPFPPCNVTSKSVSLLVSVNAKFYDRSTHSHSLRPISLSTQHMCKSDTPRLVRLVRPCLRQQPVNRDPRSRKAQHTRQAL